MFQYLLSPFTNNDVIEQQLDKVRRASLLKAAQDREKAASGFQINSTLSPYSFCSETISWYNTFYRQFLTFSCIFVSICLFLIAYLSFFKNQDTLYNLTSSSDLVYYIVVVMRSRSGFLIDGVEERNLVKVRDHFQRSLGFILDVVTFLPIGQLHWILPKGLAFIRSVGRQKTYLRLYFILNYLSMRADEPGSSTFVFRSIKYTLLSMLTVHLTACGWYGLACDRTDEAGFSLDLCSNESWIVYLPQTIVNKVFGHENVTESDVDFINQVSFLHNRYITSLYWASATATSTGYGDITANTVVEKIYSIFAMIFGMTILYGMTMGGMTSILTNIDAKRSSFVHRYKAFEKEVDRMQVSTSIKELCLNYFKYLWFRWGGEDVHSSGFLKILPESLRASFAEATFRNLLQKADLFDETGDAFHRNLSLVAKPRVFLESQFIQRSGEIASEMCYIQSGCVEVLDEDEVNVLAVMESGKLFGQVLLVFDLPRMNSIKCRTNCDVFVLDKHDFREVLAEYPECAQKFVNAVREKCHGPDRIWPMEAPVYKDLVNYIEKAKKVRSIKSVISGPVKKAEQPLMRTRARRVTTVYSTKYVGVDLPRVVLHRERKEVSVMPTIEDEDEEAETEEAQSRSKVAQSTSSDGSSKKQRKASTDSTTTPSAYEFFLEQTSVDPEGRFYRWWQTYIFFLSFFTGVYTTYLALFTTTVGQAKVYNEEEGNSIDLLQIITDTCNVTQSTLYSTQCSAFDTFSALVQCIAVVGGRFRKMIRGNSTTGYSILVPAPYDARNLVYGEGSELHYLISYGVIDLSYYINIFINFRTIVETTNGHSFYISDIFLKYNHWNLFWYDVAAVLPIEIGAGYVTCQRVTRYHLLAFMRLNRVLYFLRDVPRLFASWENSLDVKIFRIRVLKFSVYIFTFTHLSSGLFYRWACGYSKEGEFDDIRFKCRFGSWAWIYNISYTSSRAQDYITTMYWASTTMTSTGYGDISASTTTGRVWALATMVLGTVLYGWLVAVIASTVSNNNAVKVNFKNSMMDTIHYLNVHQVPKALIDRVMGVRRIEWERYKGTAVPGVQTIGMELSPQLQSVLLYECVHKLIEALPFFSGIDPSFLAMLCKHVMFFHYSEGDIIIYEGDLSRNLYIVKQGHCNIVTDDLQTVVDYLSPGDYFGECEMLFGCASPRTVAADTSCEVLCLQRADLDEVLESFPVLQHQMLQIEKDKYHRNRIIYAIKRRNTHTKNGFKMKERYFTEAIEGGVSLYAERSDKPWFLICIGCSGYKLQCYDSGNPLKKFTLCCLLPFVFNPQSKVYVFYESIRMIFIITTLVIVPIQFAFLPTNPYLMLIVYACDLLCMLDHYVKAHTAFFNKHDVLVMTPMRTVMHYWKTTFLLDLMSWLPFEFVVLFMLDKPLGELQWKFLAMFRMTRVFQAYKLYAYVSYWVSDIRWRNRWIEHISNILFGLLLHHWFACLLFVSACFPENINNDQLYALSKEWVSLHASIGPTYCHNRSWVGYLVANKIFPSLDIVHSLTDQYTVSMYWATATLVCVGYGDIHAHTYREMAMATIVMICGTVFYSYVLGDISAYIQTGDMRRGHYKGRLSDIKKFFNIYSVTKETQEQVINYYCYLWDRTRGVSPDYLLRGLPPSIRTNVCQSMYNPMIREAFNVSGDINKETEGFFRLVSSHIKPSLFLKDSIICRAQDIGEEMFFIQRGDIALLEDDNETVAKVLGPGQHFGEVALLLAMPRSRTIKALTNCDLNVLSKTNLDDILSKFPRFKQKMTAIAQDRQMQGLKSTTYDQKTGKIGRAARSGSIYNPRGIRWDLESHNMAKVIQIDSLTFVAWQHITIIMSFLSASLAIYQCGFYNQSITCYLVAYLLDMWFIVDMYINFFANTNDEFSTPLDTSPKIHVFYAKSPNRFFLDVVANAPVEFVAHFYHGLNVESKYYILTFARLNRVLRLHRFYYIFNEWEADISRNVLIVRMYKFLLMMLFTTNLVSSLWYGIACPLNVCAESSWTTLSTTDYREKDVYGFNFLPYIDSVYWSVSTMTSTGYGDIKPEQRNEMWYACVVMVIGKLMIGYVLGMVAATLANDESLRVWYEQKVMAVKHYMAELEFKIELFNHVVQYYDYVWMKNQGVNVMDLFPDLSFSLRADIYNEICRDMLNHVALFEGCPSTFLRHLCLVLVPRSYMPGDYICFQGDIRSEMYMIYRGVAEALQYENKKIVPLRLVVEGESFLSESVLCKITRPCSLRARTYVDVFSMTMEGLQSVLQYHPTARNTILVNAKKLYPALNARP